MSDDGPEVAESIRRLRAGEEQAFQVILDRFRAPLFDFCWRLLRDAGEAEEVAQETFVRAYQLLRGDRPAGGRLSTWLFLVARRQCLDVLRKRIRRQTETAPAPEAATTRTPRDQVEVAELSAAIAAAVADLPEDQRTALLLAEYEGRSTEEIAGIMEASAKSVESRLYRARQALRGRLAEWMKP